MDGQEKLLHLQLIGMPTMPAGRGNQALHIHFKHGQMKYIVLEKRVGGTPRQRALQEKMAKTPWLKK